MWILIGSYAVQLKYVKYISMEEALMENSQLENWKLVNDHKFFFFKLMGTPSFHSALNQPCWRALTSGGDEENREKETSVLQSNFSYACFTIASTYAMCRSKSNILKHCRYHILTHQFQYSWYSNISLYYFPASSYLRTHFNFVALIYIFWSWYTELF